MRATCPDTATRFPPVTVGTNPCPSSNSVAYSFLFIAFVVRADHLGFRGHCHEWTITSVSKTTSSPGSTCSFLLCLHEGRSSEQCLSAEFNLMSSFSLCSWSWPRCSPHSRHLRCPSAARCFICVDSNARHFSHHCGGMCCILLPTNSLQ